ncbi:MAG TPA: hypothetical protein VLX31_15265 [Streptosporangiaceae bacterium]|nr:hypothetical protein [Streptosporangiaceae bacterium]
MFSRQLEQLARQRDCERPAAGSTPATTRGAHGPHGTDGPAPRRAPGRTIRSQTGWALVAVGLRLAQSGGR